MKFDRKVAGIVVAVVIALGALGYASVTMAQGTTPEPTPATTPTPTPTPTLNERVAANTTKITANTASIANINSRVTTLETRHTWTCATIVEAYDTTYRFSSDTDAEFRRRAVGEAKDVMDAADSNGHREVRWTDTGVKAELAKCGR